MALRCRFQNSYDVGVFAKLTNGYCLLPVGGSQDFYREFEQELSAIPIIRTTIGGANVVGRATAGNKNGLLVPDTITEDELKNIRDSFPEEIKVRTVQVNLSDLGNVIACNDYVAFVHPDLDKETEELIADTLGVEVHRGTIANNAMVGAHCVFSNQGGLVHPHTSTEQLNELSSLLQIPISAGSINHGSDALGAGIIVNDWAAFCGMESTSTEISRVESIFRLNDAHPT